MKKELKVIDEKNKIMRITTLNERWYARPIQGKKTGLPEYEFLPSSTWIAGYYPKGIGFYKWLANKGWDEAEALKVAAGDKGSKVHYACEDIDKGIKIEITKQKYPNPTTGELEELTVEEIDCIKSFRDWLDETKPELLANELTVFGDGYAGTIDKIYRINGQIWIVDLKTAKSIWEEGKLQVSSYSHADIDYKSLKITDKEWNERKQAILQLGYDQYRTKGKSHFKFTEIEDKFDLFKVAMKIWANENLNLKPKEMEYPLIISSEFRVEQLKELTKSKKNNGKL